MTQPLVRRFTLAVLLAGLAGLLASCAWPKQNGPEVRITRQPEDEVVIIGSSAAFRVAATHGPSDNAKGLTYQWQRNNTPYIAADSQNWVNIRGATESSYTIPSAQIAHVGHYRVLVSGSPTETSQPAALAVATPGVSPITVFGAPVATRGTLNPNGCPGSYAGSVTYKRTVAKGWGWGKLAAGPFSAADGTGRPDTKVEMSGFAGDRQCDSSLVSRPALPNPKYRFTVYFPQNVPVTNAYPIVLSSFK